MTVQELIDLLKTFDPKLLVCYRCCSEYDLMEPKEIRILKLCEPRLDGWVADARPDKPTIEYVVFPGNQNHGVIVMWQVRCNDGGPHDFGPSDIPEEAICSVCRMSKNEIKKRILVNRLIRLFNSDPYTSVWMVC